MNRFIRIDIKIFQKNVPTESINQLSKQAHINFDQIIKADTGENPVNETALPKKLLIDLDFFRYPEAASQQLREKLSEYTGYSPANIMCTNGSDEALDLLVRLLTEHDDEVIICPPTFVLYEFFLNLSRAKIVSIVRNDDFSLSMDNILTSITPHTKMIILDSPGNPCGTTIEKKDIKVLLSKNIIVVVDEAYFEYCGETAIDLVRIYPNLVITRTFSKWAGLAGLRVGYVVAHEEIIDGLLHIKLPYNVNSIGQFVASYVLDNRLSFLTRLEKIISLRDLAINKLRLFKEITVYNSKTAYVVIKLNKIGSVNELQKYLQKNGIFIKPINQPLLEDCLRVNFGTKDEVNRFCVCLGKWIATYK